MRKFSMSHYQFYDPVTNNHGPKYNDAYISFINYDRYTLYINPFVIDVDAISILSIRLDDIYMALILESGLFSNKQLSTNW